MFVGHFAAGVTGKAVENTVPLWVWIGASQLLDLGWAILIMTGVEKLRVVPGQPGNPLDLYYMPWTHSLPAALLWALAAAFIAWRGFGASGRAALLLGLVVISHWLLDLIVHRPDLPLGFLGPKLGLGMWNWPLPEMALEMGLLALSGGLWIAVRKDRGQPAGPALGFVALLSVLQVVSMISGETQGPVQMGALALFGFGVAMGGAWIVDRGDLRSAMAR